MRKPGSTSIGIWCLTLSLGLLAGCDFLGIGSKKPAAAPKPPEAITSAIQNASTSTAPLSGNELVRIGRWTLTSDDFNDRLNLLKQQDPEFKTNDSNAKAAVLDGLIRQQLLVEEAEDSDIGNSKEIKDTLEDYRKTLLVQELATRLTKEVIANEDDARAYYEANKEKFTAPVTWKVSQIVTTDDASAKSILVQVLQGGDFAQIAKAQSKAANAQQGGELKTFMTGKAPFEAMQIAISNLDEGGISGVFKGPEGYYIVKVDAKTGGALKTFDDVKKDLIYGLTMQKQQTVILEHLKELAQKEKPEYNKDLIEQVVGKAGQ